MASKQAKVKLDSTIFFSTQRKSLEGNVYFPEHNTHRSRIHRSPANQQWAKVRLDGNTYTRVCMRAHTHVVTHASNSNTNWSDNSGRVGAWEGLLEIILSLWLTPPPMVEHTHTLTHNYTYPHEHVLIPRVAVWAATFTQRLWLCWAVKESVCLCVHVWAKVTFKRARAQRMPVSNTHSHAHGAVCLMQFHSRNVVYLR